MTLDPEVVRQIAATHIRAGSPPDLRQRDRALAWLLAHTDRVLPVAITQAEAAPLDVVLVDLLGRLRRPQTTPLLKRAFADPRTRTYGAAGLGQSPDPEARAVLRRTLDSHDPDEVVAALAGLAASLDPATCADITPRLTATNAEVRWMAVEAAGRIGCLSREALERIAGTDPDADVRALAQKKMSQ